MTKMVGASGASDSCTIIACNSGNGFGWISASLDFHGTEFR